MALEGNVKLPLIGTVPKAGAAIGVAVVAGAIGLYYYNKHKQATATPAATTTDQYPPDGTVGNPSDPYSTDPATGMTYGDEAVGSGGTYGAYGPYSGNYGGGGGSGGGGGGGGGSGGPPFSNNADWSVYAIQTLQADNPSLDPGAITDAIGLYISGQPVDSAQQQLIYEAIAIAGDPPVAGASGYPPKVKLASSGGPPFTTNAAWAAWVIAQLEARNPSLSNTTLTDAINLYLAGQPVDASQQQLIFEAIGAGGDPPVPGANGYPPKVKGNGGGGGGGSAVNPVTNLRVTQPGYTGIDIAWDPSQGATSYTVKATKGNVTMTGATSARIGSINPASHPGASSTVTVLANPAAAGAKPASITITTK